MDINLVVDFLINFVNFIVNNISTIALIPLVIYYIRNQMWIELFNLAVKESSKFAQLDKSVLSNEEKKEGVVEAINTKFISNFFKQESKEDMAESAYRLKVKE